MGVRCSFVRCFCHFAGRLIIHYYCFSVHISCSYLEAREGGSEKGRREGLGMKDKRDKNEERAERLEHRREEGKE